MEKLRGKGRRNEERDRDGGNKERTKRGGEERERHSRNVCIYLYGIEFIAEDRAGPRWRATERKRRTRTRAHNLCSHYATTKIHYGQQALSRRFGDRSWLGLS